MSEAVKRSFDAADAGLAARVEFLRAQRCPRERAVRLDAAVGVHVEALKKLRRRLGGAGGAWGACCPEDLVDRTRPIGLRGGVLSVSVADASTRYRVDRWLRSGGLLELSCASSAPLRRVRLELGSR